MIEEGAYADILLIDGNLLKDFSVVGTGDQWFGADPRYPQGEHSDANMCTENSCDCSRFFLLPVTSHAKFRPALVSWSDLVDPTAQEFEDLYRDLSYDQLEMLVTL